MPVPISPKNHKRQRQTSVIAGLDQEAVDSTIKVAVRFRPANKNEKSRRQGGDDVDGEWHVLRGGVEPCHSVAQVGVPPVKGQTLFSFDYIFHGGCGDADGRPGAATTADVYEATCRPVVDGVASGIDGTIFAYGQTGSGKTHTMQGAAVTSSDGGGCGGPGKDGDGIVQMAAQDIFRFIQSHPEREFLIRTSYVEVYNEVVRDLLTRESPPPTVAVREDRKTGVHVNATEVVVTDHASLIETLYLGNRNRSVATTDMNARSSRSHAIFRITLESREKYVDFGSSEEDCGGSIGSDDGAVLVSTLNLVDLAGSESVRCTGTTGRRTQECGKINQSLLALSNVIHSLSQPSSKRPKFINYRDSKLTRILQPSLSGNARMAVLCCASPSAMYIEETRSTLKFASRAKHVHVHAHKNELVMDDRALIRRLQKELAATKRALSEAEERERQHLSKSEETASASDSRQKLARLKSIILRGGNLRLDSKHRRQSSHETVLHRQSSKNQPSTSLDPAIWGKDQKKDAVSGSSKPRRRILGASCRIDNVGRNLHRYSVVDMPIDDAGAMLQLIEEEDTASEPESEDDGQLATSNVSMEGSDVQYCADDLFVRRPSSDQRPTSESDIFREALASKCNANRSLNTKNEQLEAQVAFLRSELDSTSQEAKSLKLEKDDAQARSDALFVENAALKEQLCILPQMSLWHYFFGAKRQNIFDCLFPRTNSHFHSTSEDDGRAG